jgi:hypothetical protein
VLSAVAGACCLTAVALALVQALLRVVLAYAPSGIGGDAAIVQVNPYSGFAAKLALFSTDGAGLTVAVVLLVAVVVLAATGPGPDAHGPQRYTRALAMGALVLAAVTVVANAAAAVEVLADSQGALQVIANEDRAAGVLGFLSPLVISAGAGLYVAARLRRGLPSSEPGATEAARKGPAAQVE